MFWGKHINREPPVKNPPPTLSEQIDRVRQVNLIQVREKQSQLPSSWLHQMLGLFTPEEQQLLEESSSRPDLPPGLHPHPTVDLDHAFSFFDVDHANLGVYPLKTSHAWFNPQARISRPTQPVQTHAIALRRAWSPDASVASGLAGLLLASQRHLQRQPFSDFERWETASASKDSHSTSSPDSHSFFLDPYCPQSYCWEVITEVIAPVSNDSHTTPRLVHFNTSFSTSASSSTSSLSELLDQSLDFPSTPTHSSTAKRTIPRAGKEDALAF